MRNANKIWIVLAVYFALGLLLFRYYQYYIISDFVAYADIAKKYLAGDFYNAVNGIWGVLISWLLAPFLLLKINPLVAFKILVFLIGGLTVFGFSRLMKKFALNEKTETLLLLISVPVVLSFAFVHTTPDLLVACILIFYLNAIFDDNYSNSIWYGALVGLLGGLGYLAKHYFFPFIAVHLLLTHAFHFFGVTDTVKRKKILINLAASYSVFLLISIPWIGILSHKYGFFTIGTSMAYNRAWMAPLSLGHAPEYLGLVPPPNPTANSMWEDLTYYTKLMPGYDWSPIDNWTNFKHQIKLVGKNLLETFLIFNKFSLVLGPTILLFSLVNAFKKIKSREIFLDKIFLSLVVIVLYGGGYLLIRTSDRYIWIACFLLLFIGGLYLEKFDNFLSGAKNKKIIMALTIAFFSLSFLFTPIRRFFINVNQDKWIYDLSNELRGRGISGNIASNYNWTNTSILSYYLNTKYFGMPPKDIAADKLIRQFNNYRIDYFFEWAGSEKIFDLANRYDAIRLDDLTVYKLR